MQLIINSKSKRQIIDITDLINKQLDAKASGIANLFVKHTTAAVTIADLDPGTDQDILDALKSMTPKLNWRHPHDPSHFPDHLWATLIGPSISIPFTKGRLDMGTWQSLILIELDGPRERKIELTLLTS